ncbi:hypothetical protein [Pseudoduganella sp. HUAS MS19]
MNIRAVFFTTLFCVLSTAASAAPSTLTLSGRYEYRTDPASLEMLDGRVCFYPTGRSATLLPRPASDQRLPWFCFKNDAQAKKLLGLPGQRQAPACGVAGEATVKVADYVVFLEQADGYDTAVLHAVSGRKEAGPLPCEEG